MTRKVRFVPVAGLLLWACSASPPATQEVARFPLDGLDGVIAQSDATFDPDISMDGQGSLRIEAAESTVVHLFEVADPDIASARLFYEAKLRTEHLEGQAFLEMWCHFPGRGEFFARGLRTPLSGTQGWNTQETFFQLGPDDRPDRVKLNVVITGSGTVWVDDIRLYAGPL